MLNYRSATDIIAMILFTAINGERKSSIMSKAHLNYGQIKKYIKILMINDLVVERSNLSEGSMTYHTTEKGKTILKCMRIKGIQFDIKHICMWNRINEDFSSL